MRIIRGSITILKSEQGHSPALCREMIAQKAANTLRPARPKALEDKADMGFWHADRSRILAQSHIHHAITVQPSEPAPRWRPEEHPHNSIHSCAVRVPPSAMKDKINLRVSYIRSHIQTT